jgi:hypothetical protein
VTPAAYTICDQTAGCTYYVTGPSEISKRPVIHLLPVASPLTMSIILSCTMAKI